MAKKAKNEEEPVQQEKKPVKKRGTRCGMPQIVMMIAILAIGIVVGALAIYATAGSPKVVTVPGECQTPTVDLSAIESKVADYIETNLLGSPDLSLSINDATLMGQFYNITFDVMQNGTPVGSGMVVASNTTLVIPNIVLDMDEPLSIPEEQPPADIPPTDTPAVDLFIMSFCPYGMNAVEQMIPVVQLLGEKADFKLSYVLYSDFASQYGVDWSDYCSDESEAYCSMHGIGEVNEDVRQLCIQEHQSDKLWAYMSQVTAAYNAGTISASNMDDEWEALAQAAGVDVDAVKSCVADESDTLLAEQAALDALYGADASPTLVVNGVQAQISMTPESLKTGICGAFITEPGECQQDLGSTGATVTGSC